MLFRSATAADYELTVYQNVDGVNTLVTPPYVASDTAYEIRDAAMYRHAMRSLYCKIKGDYVGKTVKHEDESGCVQMLFREVDKLMKRNKELEAIIQERKR